MKKSLTYLFALSTVFICESDAAAVVEFNRNYFDPGAVNAFRNTSPQVKYICATNRNPFSPWRALVPSSDPPVQGTLNNSKFLDPHTANCLLQEMLNKIENQKKMAMDLLKKICKNLYMDEKSLKEEEDLDRILLELSMAKEQVSSLKKHPQYQEITNKEKILREKELLLTKYIKELNAECIGALSNHSISERMGVLGNIQKNLDNSQIFLNETRFLLKNLFATPDQSKLHLQELLNEQDSLQEEALIVADRTQKILESIRSTSKDLLSADEDLFFADKKLHRKLLLIKRTIQVNKNFHQLLKNFDLSKLLTATYQLSKKLQEIQKKLGERFFQLDNLPLESFQVKNQSEESRDTVAYVERSTETSKLKTNSRAKTYVNNDDLDIHSGSSIKPIKGHEGNDGSNGEDFASIHQQPQTTIEDSSDKLFDVLFAKINANKASEPQKVTTSESSLTENQAVEKTGIEVSIDHSKTSSSNSSDVEVSNKLNKMTMQQTHIDPAASIESISMIKE